MNKSRTILCTAALALLLGGCASSNTNVTDSSTPLFSVGNVTYTKGNEYELIKKVNGPSLTLQAVQKLIYDAEVGDGEEIQKEAKDMYDLYSQYSDNFAQQLKTYGYADEQAYIDSVLVPSVQAQKLVEKYFTDGQETIEPTFKPTIAAIIACDSQDNADKARKALEDGESPEKVGEQYAMENAAYTGKEQVISTLNTDLPVRIVNTLYETTKSGVLDETFTTDTSTDSVTYYVVDLISNDYAANVQKIYEALSSNSTINKDCTVYYLKKYDFEVHDQYVFDYFRANDPEYLVTRPDLSENQ